MRIFLTWTDFKTHVTVKSALRYVDRDTFYSLSYSDDAGGLETTILKDAGADQTDFEANYQSLANAPFNLKDKDGAEVSRNKVAKSGWTYQARSLEFTTSTISSMINDKHDGTAWADATVKFYDASDVEQTTSGDISANTVKTVIDWEALYDFELIGGHVSILTDPASSVRLWVVAVPDLTEAQGGSKVMINGINMNFMAAKTSLAFDGRASKLMSYDATYHTNKMRLIVRHDVGKVLKMAVVWEHYKQ